MIGAVDVTGGKVLVRMQRMKEAAIPMPAAKKAKIITLVEDRATMAHHSLHSFAALLDPEYRDMPLSDTMVVMAGFLEVLKRFEPDAARQNWLRASGDWCNVCLGGMPMPYALCEL